MRFIIMLLALLSLSTVLEVALSKWLWAWFIAPQYGAGPTTLTWFGVWALHGVAQTASTAKSEHDADTLLIRACALTLVKAALVAVVALAGKLILG